MLLERLTPTNMDTDLQILGVTPDKCAGWIKVARHLLHLFKTKAWAACNSSARAAVGYRVCVGFFSSRVLCSPRKLAILARNPVVRLAYYLHDGFSYSSCTQSVTELLTCQKYLYKLVQCALGIDSDFQRMKLGFASPPAHLSGWVIESRRVARYTHLQL